MILYSTGCPQCACLKKALDDKGCKYDICDDVDFMIANGFKTVPLLDVEGKILDFKSAMQLLKTQGVIN